jgi:hypothetical protein
MGKGPCIDSCPIFHFLSLPLAPDSFRGLFLLLLALAEKLEEVLAFGLLRIFISVDFLLRKC